MIGQRIESRTSIPWGVLFFAGIGVVLLTLALVHVSMHLALAAVLPLASAASLLWSRPGPFSGEITETGLRIESPSVFEICYGEIEGLVAAKPKKASRFPIKVFHPLGVLFLPQRLNVSSRDVYDFLAGRLSRSGARILPEQLMGALRKHEELFGKDRVLSFRARRFPANAVENRQSRALWGALAVSGLCWLLAALLLKGDYVAWGIGGGLCLFFGGVLFAIPGRFLTDPSSPRARDHQSGLVIGPLGIALVQADLKGEARWDEITDICHPPKARHFQLSSSHYAKGIEVFFEGGSVVLRDIYDRPLAHIHNCLLSYWKDPPSVTS